MTLAEFGMTQQRTTLSNGSSVLLFRRQGMPITIRASFDAGGRYDPEGREGQAHFVEHMMVAGSEHFPQKTDMAAYIEAVGGEFMATTSKEEVTLDLSVAEANDLPRATNLLREMLLKSHYDTSTVDRERESVRGEIGNRRANPSAELYCLESELFYQGTPLGRWTTGTDTGVDACDSQSLRDYHYSMLTADRMAITVCGDIELAPLVTALETALTDLPRQSPIPRASAVAAKRMTPIMVTTRANSQIYITYGYRTVPLGHTDSAALGLIAEILGGGRAASLSRILRQERGLIYSIWADHEQLAAGGVWSLTTTASADNTPAVIAGITEEIGRVYNGGLTKVELDFAKQKKLKSLRMRLQTSRNWVDFHSLQHLQLAAPWDVGNYIRSLEAIDLPQLHNVAARYFEPGRHYIAAIGDITIDDLA